MSSHIPSTVSKLLIKQLIRSSTFKWLCIIGTTGTILISIGCYIRYIRKSKPRALRTGQLTRSGGWKSINFGSLSAPLTPVTQVADLSSEQLFDNGVVSFNQAVNSWRACCEVLNDQDIDLDTTLTDSDSISTIHSLPNSRVNERRVRTLLLQADTLSHSIDNILSRSRANGSVLRVESYSSESEHNKINRNSPLPFQDYLSDTSEDNNNNNKYSHHSDTESFQSATLQSDSDSLTGFSPYRHHSHSILPTIILTTNALYKQGLIQAKSNKVFVRKMRTEMLNCDNDVDFMAKLFCVRSAFDLLVLSEENCLFFENKTNEMMTRFLTSANKDANAFNRAFRDIIDFVKLPQNATTINKELNARNLKVVGFWDVAIDFALLDAFTDLDNLPTPVTMVTQNRWLTPGLRESAITNAVWAVMQGKIKMLENKSGFMSHFYKLGETFMFTLAWGFLGTDEELKETCVTLRKGILSYLKDIFDLNVANYSSVDTLAEDILAIGNDRMTQLNSRL